MFIAAITACAPQQAHALTVTATVKGTIVSGVDTTGVFGTPGSLAGQAFTAIFTFDSNEGAAYNPFSSLQPPNICYNGLKDSNQNTSAQVSLLINGHPYPYTFRAVGASAVTWSLYLENYNNNQITLGLTYNTTFPTTPTQSTDNIGMVVILNQKNACHYWSDNASYTLPYGGGGFYGSSGFYIRNYVTSKENTPPYQLAQGGFNVALGKITQITITQSP
jgi:hypothetical protein